MNVVKSDDGDEKVETAGNLNKYPVFSYIKKLGLFSLGPVHDLIYSSNNKILSIVLNIKLKK